MEEEFMNTSYIKNQMNQNDNNIEAKPNSTNTLKRLYNPDQEIVQKLNYYKIGKNRSTKNSMYLKSNPNNDINSLSKGFSLLKGCKIHILYYIVLPNLKLKEPTKIELKYKYVYKNRAENQGYEIQLDKKRKILEEKKKEIKLEKTKMKKLISTILKDLEDLTISIEFLSNFDKYFDMQERMKKSIEMIQIESFLVGGADIKDKKKRMEEDFDKMTKLRSNVMVILCLIKKSTKQRENDVIEKKEELASKKKFKEELYVKLDELKSRIKAVQKENKEIKNELLVHYHNLLIEGKDTRKDGLVWIIKAIWDLGYDILVSYLPTFLDDKSIAFIFQVLYIFNNQYALRDIDLQRIKNNIDEIKLKLKMLKQKNKTFKTEVVIKVYNYV